MQKISMYDANDFVESVIIDGESYDLHFMWNPISEAWFLDIRTATKEDIVRGIAVVPNFPILNQHRRITGLPRGEFMAVVANITAGPNIGRYDFLNGKFSFVYIPRGEINEILEAKISDSVS